MVKSYFVIKNAERFLAQDIGRGVSGIQVIASELVCVVGRSMMAVASTRLGAGERCDTDSLRAGLGGGISVWAHLNWIGGAVVGRWCENRAKVCGTEDCD